MREGRAGCDIFFLAAAEARGESLGDAEDASEVLLCGADVGVDGGDDVSLVTLSPS